MTSGLVMTLVLWAVVTAVLVTGGVALGYELGARSERRRRARRETFQRLAREQVERLERPRANREGENR